MSVVFQVKNFTNVIICLRVLLLLDKISCTFIIYIDAIITLIHAVNMKKVVIRISLNKP